MLGNGSETLVSWTRLHALLETFYQHTSSPLQFPSLKGIGLADLRVSLLLFHAPYPLLLACVSRTCMTCDGRSQMPGSVDILHESHAVHRAKTTTLLACLGTGLKKGSNCSAGRYSKDRYLRMSLWPEGTAPSLLLR